MSQLEVRRLHRLYVVSDAIHEVVCNEAGEASEVIDDRLRRLYVAVNQRHALHRSCVAP